MDTDTESVGGVAGDDTTHHHRGKRKYNSSSLIYVNSANVAPDDDDDWNANHTTFLPPTAALFISRDDPDHNNKRRRPPNRQYTSIQYSRISVSPSGSGNGIGVSSTVDSDPSNDNGLRMPQQQNLPQEYTANHSNYYDNNTFTIVNQERRVTLPSPPPSSSSSSSKKTVVRQHMDVTFQKDPSAAVATIQATNYRPTAKTTKIDTPSLQQMSRYTDINSSTTTSFPSHGNVPSLQLRSEQDVDRHHVGSATATASMDYYHTTTSMLPHQRYNHHFQFFVVWILIPIMVVVVVVAATAMRMMVVVRATPFPTIMLDLGNVETTTTTASTTFSPTSATTTTISTLTLTSSEAVVFTLRDILTDSTTGFHLAIAPSFFGFFGYFGMVAAWLVHDPQEHPYDNQHQLMALDCSFPHTRCGWKTV
jgi:hypothetical protein